MECLFYEGLITLCKLPFLRNQNMPMTEQEQVKREFCRVCIAREFRNAVTLRA
jgi:hypothetical protein